MLILLFYITSVKKSINADGRGGKRCRDDFQTKGILSIKKMDGKFNVSKILGDAVLLGNFFCYFKVSYKSS